MVLPLFIVGTAGTGAATGYGMYQVGTALALPSSVSEAPPKSASSLTAGGITAVAAYSVQGRILNRYLSHLLTYEHRGALIAPRVAMFSTSVALMGFVSTKMDLSRGKKPHIKGLDRPSLAESVSLLRDLQLTFQFAFVAEHRARTSTQLSKMLKSWLSAVCYTALSLVVFNGGHLAAADEWDAKVDEIMANFTNVDIVGQMTQIAGYGLVNSTYQLDKEAAVALPSTMSARI
ncbi:hypothetical protein GQ600_13982 [Phytophthora cactorum]|nr:hypothetical protein GQ600_13982 [Phytophthora cactorum]